MLAPAANPNTNTSISVCTAVGFRTLKAEDYMKAAEHLQPDIVVGLGDIPYGRALGSKRIEKATDRQIQWMQDHVAMRNSNGKTKGRSKLFAPLSLVSCANQRFYMDCLTEQLGEEVSGLAFYNLAPLEDLPAALHSLPRLAFTEPSTPHDILQQISMGLDVFTIPFISAATDAGIALDFTLPAPQITPPGHEHVAPRALGIDMWLAAHATDLSPLTEGCKCYACTNHHRAYIQHLLLAKEMLGWILLQIHNHHVLDLFFAGIRQSIALDVFDSEWRRFEEVYDAHLPEKTGQGPRVRGYQFKSEGPGEAKKNKAAFTMLDDGKEKIAEARQEDVEVVVDGKGGEGGGSPAA